jgi:acetyl esterase/lipase
VLRPNTRELNIIFSAPYTAADWQLLNFVSPASPPALLVHGGGDKLVDARNSAALSQALHAAGVAATVTIVPGGSHGDPVAAFAALGRKRAPSLEQTRAFIDARSRELDNAMRGR